MSQKYFSVKGGSKKKTKCKECKNTFENGELMIARFNRMKQWYHIDCIFQHVRLSTLKIADPVKNIEGWNNIAEKDKALITEKVAEQLHTLKKKKKKKKTPVIYPFSDQDPTLFSSFSSLCTCLETESDCKKKSEMISSYLSKLRGDKEESAALVVRMLLPAKNSSFKSRFLMYIFSKIFPKEKLNEKLKQNGDISVVIGDTYESKRLFMKSTISLTKMNDMLFELSGKTRINEQYMFIKNIMNNLCSREEVITFIRLINDNLKINTSVKNIFDSVGIGAYEAFCTNQDINQAVLIGQQQQSLIPEPRMFVPVMPMSTRSCKSSAAAIKKIFRGGEVYFEIKYSGGERVQVHKKDNKFVFFSRGHLKQKLKVEDVEEYLIDAFPEAETFILDAEVLMVCKKTGKPINKNERKDIFFDFSLFIFDVLLYNGDNMLIRPLSDRRRLLETEMIEQKNRVVLSERFNSGKEELDKTLQQVGTVVIKDIQGYYEPGKRHWLIVKTK